jgi:Trk K+ transport system NAD-binding subunit
VTDLILWVFRVCLRVDSSSDFEIARLGERHGVYELSIRKDSKFSGGAVSEIEAQLGLKPLGVFRADGTYVGTLPSDIELQDYDRIVVYGHDDQIKHAARVVG